MLPELSIGLVIVNISNMVDNGFTTSNLLEMTILIWLKQINLLIIKLNSNCDVYDTGVGRLV